MHLYFSLLLLFFAPLLTAETPSAPSLDFEGGFTYRRPIPNEVERPRIDRLTWTFLAADGGARILDAYSTRRMMKNSCSSGKQMVGVSTCNYEQNLPGFIANSAGGIYAFEGAAWLTELGSTRFLIQHHHRRLARFISLIDFASTTSFAVNNLTLSIGKSQAIGTAASESNRNRNR
jgi:hypothetical protein